MFENRVLRRILEPESESQESGKNVGDGGLRRVYSSPDIMMRWAGLVARVGGKGLSYGI